LVKLLLLVIFRQRFTIKKINKSQHIKDKQDNFMTIYVYIAYYIYSYTLCIIFYINNKLYLILNLYIIKNDRFNRIISIKNQ